MNVLIIASYADSLIRFRGELICSLVSSGACVHVACPIGDSDLKTVEILEMQGVIVHAIPMQRAGTNPFSDIKTMFYLYLLMKKNPPSSVLAYTVKPVIYGLISARLANVPIKIALITGLGYAFTGVSTGLRGFVQGVVRRLYTIALKGSQLVFYQNPDDQSYFLSMGITNPKTRTCVVNGSGIDIDMFPVSPLPTAPVFLLIARLLGDKGIRDYVEAAKLVKNKYPQTCFHLVGWIDENPDAIDQYELDSWIKQGVIEFKGKLTDVRPAISESSVYVLPSYREGTPRTVLEAMAMGRAVITTDAPGCRETVVDGLNGKLVAVKSINELADAMVKLIENPKLIKQYGTQSRRMVEDKYDVHKDNDYMLKEMRLLNEKNS